jgi:hypothetical protein
LVVSGAPIKCPAKNPSLHNNQQRNYSDAHL